MAHGEALFSTHVLDESLTKTREKREQQRQKQMKEAFAALEVLSERMDVQEVYLFGSLIKPHRFYEESDIDFAFAGLKDQDFFQAIAFLSRKLGRDVDVIQLEDSPLREKVVREGVKWRRTG